MTESIEQFFRDYVEAFNRSLGGSVDVDAIRSCFSSCFVGAGPEGVRCASNNDEFADTLRQGYAFYSSIGTKSMAIRAVESTRVDDLHQLARVEYQASYVKSSGEEIDIDFNVTYLLALKAKAWEIFAFISGDEMALYREKGLLPN